MECALERFADMKFAFYVSGSARRLRKLLSRPHSALLRDTRLVISDSLANQDLAPMLCKKGIRMVCVDYAALGAERAARQQALSDLLLAEFERDSIDTSFCFGDHLLKGELLVRYAHRIINFHPSLLPAFPGRKAIDQAQEAGAFLMGNTAHFVDASVDAGPVIMQCVVPAALFRSGGYDAVLDTQLTMVEQIHRWLVEARIHVGPDGEVVVDRARSGAPAFFPPLDPEQPLHTEAAANSDRPEPLHVGRPNVGNRARLFDRFNDILGSCWFTNNGPYVKQFEQRIAEFLGVKHCVAICNATVALEIACRALDLKGEVIMPAYTFAATAHAFQWQEVRPRFADIDPLTHNLDPESVESLITPLTSAIVGVHVWGRACDTAALEAIGRHHDLTVLYDAAHAFGCTHGGRMIGGFGRCEVFSFHATKFLNSFEGGAVTTNDDALAEKLRLMRNFGFTGVDRVAHLGVNGKMTEVCAAMGITSLEAIDELVATNRRNYEAYHAELTGLPGLTVLRYSEQEKSNFQYIVVEIDPANCPRDRDDLVAALQRQNVLARKYFWPGCHRMEPYCSRPDGIPTLPATERVAARVMILPTGQAVNMDSVKRIGRILRGALT